MNDNLCLPDSLLTFYYPLESYKNCKPVWPAQALAAAAELAIPHFVSASIFAVTGTPSPERFQHNLRMLMVRFCPFRFFCLVQDQIGNHCTCPLFPVAACCGMDLVLFLSNEALCFKL